MRPDVSLTVVLVLNRSGGLLVDDLLVSLEAQTDQDFELIADARWLARSELEDLRARIARFDGGVAERTSVLSGSAWTRRRELATALEHSSGRLLAPIDQDVLFFGRWVEHFSALAVRANDRVLHAPGAQQSFSWTQWPDGRAGYVAVTAPEIAAVTEGFASLGTYAIPRTCAPLLERALRARPQRGWDEGLFVASVERCGVEAGDGDVTSMRRRWTADSEQPSATT